MKKKEFGNRMKFYEKQFDQRFTPMLPVIVRLDGRCFSKLTKNLERPFDTRFRWVMMMLTKDLVEETNARIGYTQSDEITLVLHTDRFDSEIYFAGRVQKIVSVLASLASVRFNKHVPNVDEGSLPIPYNNPTMFDCRAFTVPNKQEAYNQILWRVRDSIRNSIIAVAQSYYSHNELHGKSCSDMQDMIHAKGDNWNDYPTYLKEGWFVRRKTIERSFTDEEMKKLPKQHAARFSPDFKIKRHVIEKLDIGRFSSISNPIEFIFDQAEPTYFEEKTL